MTKYVHHMFMPNGEFWLAPHSVEKLWEIGTIVLVPDFSPEKFYLWNGKCWINYSREDLPASIKAFLLSYSVPDALKQRIKQGLDHEPIYLCNWK